MTTQTGWMPGVTIIKDREHGYPSTPDGGLRAQAIINHIMQGFRSTMDDWARSPFSTRRSVQFGIDRAGNVAQYVSIFDAAYHAGRLDYVNGVLVRPTWKLWDPNSPNPNEHTIGVEHEGFSTDPDYAFDYIYDEFHPWPEPMIKASIEVQSWCLNQLSLEANEHTIIGHYETSPVSRHDDPGQMWPRARLLQALGPITEPISPPLTYTERAYVRAIAAFTGWTGLEIIQLPMIGDDRVYLLTFGDIDGGTAADRIREPQFLRSMGFVLHETITAVEDDQGPRRGIRMRIRHN